MCCATITQGMFLLQFKEMVKVLCQMCGTSRLGKMPVAGTSKIKKNTQKRIFAGINKEWQTINLFTISGI